MIAERLDMLKRLVELSAENERLRTLLALKNPRVYETMCSDIFDKYDDMRREAEHDTATARREFNATLRGD